MPPAGGSSVSTSALAASDGAKLVGLAVPYDGAIQENVFTVLVNALSPNEWDVRKEYGCESQRLPVTTFFVPFSLV